MEGDDKDAIQRDVDALMQLSHAVAEEAYKRAAGGQQAGAQGQQEAPGESQQQKKPDEDVVDADFEEVKK